MLYTVVFDGPAPGVNPEMYGPAPMTVNGLGLVAVPPGPVTVMLPLVAPEGTLRNIWVPVESVVKLALVPLNLTDVAPRK